MKNTFYHFEKLAELTKEKQAEYLDRLKCDKALKEKLKKLLTVKNEDYTKIFEDTINEAFISLSKKVKIGDYISKYKITNHINQGGMSYVYLAERNDGHYSQKVAIKIIPNELLNFSNNEIFIYEAQALASLDHRNIVSIIDAGNNINEFSYLVMPYIDGTTLTNYIKKLDNDIDKIKIFNQILDGVIHAHTHQIIHQDLKPENILVDTYGTVKIIDFGISKLTSSTYTNSNNNKVIAYSENFSSPEQKKGLSLTTSSDIYSLGKILEKLKIDNKEITYVIKKSTCESIEDRYQTVTELKSDINKLNNKRPTSANDSRYTSLMLFLQRNARTITYSSLFLIVILIISANYYNSYSYAKKQEILADSNLKLAENMLSQVDVKVVTELDRQRSLVDSASKINLEILPESQAIRFTLSVVQAYKTIGDYSQCLKELTKLQTLLTNSVQYPVEKVIAEKIGIELAVLNSQRENYDEKMSQLILHVKSLPQKKDNRLFQLLDWEIGSFEVANNKIHDLFKALEDELEPKDINQTVLLQEVRAIADSDTYSSEQLSKLEETIELIEKNRNLISSRRLASSIHNWYVSGANQGKLSPKNLDDKFNKNISTLNSLFDVNHPSVYVLSILAKQIESTKDFKFNDEIDNIYKEINPESLPPTYRQNYYIIELTNLIKNEEYKKAYEIMKKVSVELQNYGENALNYYMQFVSFADVMGHQEWYIFHLKKILDHYQSINKISHIGYFSYALCNSYAKLPKSSPLNKEDNIKICENSIEFYKKYQGNKSNLYITSMLSKLELLTKLDYKNNYKNEISELLLLKKHINYPRVKLQYYRTMLDAFINLSEHTKARKIIEQAKLSKEISMTDVKIMEIKLATAVNDTDSYLVTLKQLSNLGCEFINLSQINEINRISESDFMNDKSCSKVSQKNEILSELKKINTIYSSTDKFISTI